MPDAGGWLGGLSRSAALLERQWSSGSRWSIRSRGGPGKRAESPPIVVVPLGLGSLPASQPSTSFTRSYPHVYNLETPDAYLPSSLDVVCITRKPC
jgi:hypothetical protein